MHHEPIDMPQLINALSSDFENLKNLAIDANSSIGTLLEWSSLNALVLTARIKRDFGVELLPGELRATETYRQLLDLINIKRSG